VNQRAAARGERTVACTIALLGAVSGGCSEVIGLSDLVYDRAPTGAGGAPPGMVAFDDGNGQTIFIDAREVTVAEYASWLAEGPAPALGGTRCAFNDSLVPLVPSPGGNAEDCETNGVDWEADRAQHPDWPVRCIDWCDAAEYCAQHDKRLCGRIGGGTVATHYEGAEYVIDDPRSSEWYMACSMGASRAYPYADAYQAATCNGESGGPEAVGARNGCEGGYDGLFDMSGNIEEWEDACEPAEGGAEAACMRRGGAYYTAQFHPTSWLACGKPLPDERGAMGTSTGFRCCAGP
jgi:formylglycine-generating enzyme